MKHMIGRLETSALSPNSLTPHIQAQERAGTRNTKGLQIKRLVYLLFLGPLNATVINVSHFATNKAWKPQCFVIIVISTSAYSCTRPSNYLNDNTWRQMPRLYGQASKWLLHYLEMHGLQSTNNVLFLTSKSWRETMKTWIIVVRVCKNV